jgi:DNA polymerase epsilon subunit 1
MPNHLVGVRRKLLKLEFNNVSDLLGARKLLMPIVESNKARRETADSYVEVSL